MQRHISVIELPNAFCGEPGWSWLKKQIELPTPPAQRQNNGQAQQIMFDSTTGKEIKNLMCVQAKDLSESEFWNLAYCIGILTEVYYMDLEVTNLFILFEEFDRSIIASMCNVKDNDLNIQDFRPAKLQQPLPMNAIILMLDFTVDKQPTFHTGDSSRFKKRKVEMNKLHN
uniref:AlNc14C66G4695 protein n=1 Tax=Albugo laibachii Nc14 TaxID=890382 RepID=F0WDH6_9STRA|nr:AlNc14C66G4695 [Albugo laibachii Nc14]|eukprot:CCA19248.1 AlNc14C66G4695 [Albugo laibachii Nc14]